MLRGVMEGPKTPRIQYAEKRTQIKNMANYSGNGRNPLKIVLYIAAVILLVVCIVLMYFHTRREREAYQEEIRQLSLNETEYIRSERSTEEESETAGQETESASSGESGRQTASDEAREEESLMEGESSSEEDSSEEDETEAASETETETETEDESKDLRVLLLNGTGVGGVAGYWETQLEEDGYTDVIAASYEEEAAEETVIYASNRQQALPFQEYFTDSRIRIGSITEGILMSDGEEEPEDVDIYIVIGRTDARNE